MTVLYCTFAHLGDAVEHEADSALTAVGAHQVDTAMVATHIACTTLIHVCRTAGRGEEERE